MELRERAEHLLRPQAPTPIPPASSVTKELRRMEVSLHNRRWLRGAMCILAIICYALSLFESDSYVGGVIIHTLMLLLSLTGEAAIVGVYRVKARLHGMHNKASREASVVSVLHSPSLGKMLLEMFIWIIQCPPGLRSDNPWAAALDSIIVLRFYVFLFFLTNVSHASAFARAIANVTNIRLSHRFFIRTALLAENVFLTFVGAALGLIILSLCYTRAEGADFADAVYFCLTTAAMMGFGDVAPITFAGRITAVCAWVLGVLVLCWVVGAMSHVLSLGETERNLYALFRSNELCGLLPSQAVRLIQRTWKLYVTRRDGRHVLARQVAAFLFTQQALAFREMRRELHQCEADFLRATFSYTDYFTLSTSPGSSRGTSATTSPTLTPRTKRPFSTFRRMLSKSELRALTPRSHPAPGGFAEREKAEGTRSPMEMPTTPLTERYTTATVQSVAELEQRLARLEGNLERLAANAERLEGRLGIQLGVSV